MKGVCSATALRSRMRSRTVATACSELTAIDHSVGTSSGYAGVRTRLIRALGESVQLRRQLQNLLRDVEQLVVLLVLVLKGSPLLVGKNLALGVRGVLA